MIDPLNITGILYEHMIAAAERSLPTEAEARAMPTAELQALETNVAALYEERRIAMEGLMLAPFRPFRSDA